MTRCTLPHVSQPLQRNREVAFACQSQRRRRGLYIRHFIDMQGGTSVHTKEFTIREVWHQSLLVMGRRGFSTCHSLKGGVASEAIAKEIKNMLSILSSILFLCELGEKVLPLTAVLR